MFATMWILHKQKARTLPPCVALQTETVAVLTAAAPVLQLEFNALGSWLAASTAAGQVQMWRPALDGSWNLLTSVQGTQEAEQLD